MGSKIDTEIRFTLLYSPTTALIKPEAFNLYADNLSADKLSAEPTLYSLVMELNDSPASTVWSKLRAEVQKRGM